MSLLTIVNRLALNVGIEQTDQVAASTDREIREAISYSNLVGEELARRVDFGELRNESLFVGDGTNLTFDLPSDFSRIIPGVGVTFSEVPVRPLDRAEWMTLPPYAGVPRYFSLEGRRIKFWPYMRDGAIAKVTWQSKAWCSNGNSFWLADEDTSLIDETLMVKGLIVRWRRQKGMDFADYEAEYEQSLADIARFDDRSRI